MRLILNDIIKQRVGNCSIPNSKKEEKELSEYVLELKGITKIFPGVKALDHVSFQLKPGEIHALMGENGAGKSTLIKIIAGAIECDSGALYVDNVHQKDISPYHMRQLGIEVIYQEFNLVPALSVAENIYLGSFLGNGVVVDMASMEQRAGHCKKCQDSDYG